jgi:hypothetical protein
MDKAKLDIEKRLVPQGANIVRHLSLPSQGKSLEWIMSEMDKMDAELDSPPEQWRMGKLSGAVYRKLYAVSAMLISFKYNLTQMVATIFQNSLSQPMLVIVYQIHSIPTFSRLFVKWKPKSFQCVSKCTVVQKVQQG